MNPSRELDKLIAEKVMNWDHQIDSGDRNCDGVQKFRCGVCGKTGHGNCFGWSIGGEAQVPCDCWPRYSTDIVAAWSVFEKIGDYGAWVGYYTSPCVWDGNTWPDGSPADTISGDTIPHAICLWALQKKGILV